MGRNIWGFSPGPTQTKLFDLRLLEAGHFRLRRWRDCSRFYIFSETKALDSVVLTAKHMQIFFIFDLLLKIWHNPEIDLSIPYPFKYLQKFPVTL